VLMHDSENEAPVATTAPRAKECSTSPGRFVADISGDRSNKGIPLASEFSPSTLQLSRLELYAACRPVNALYVSMRTGRPKIEVEAALNRLFYDGACGRYNNGSGDFEYYVPHGGR
jgi:hypothetical protein